jgi:enamine deaminase RidA (YjgF/YER057c/UK114 family)
MSDAFNPPGVIEPFGVFSNAAWQPEGRVLHVSGQVAWDTEGRIVGPGDIARQTRQVLFNVQTILESVGGAMADIVSVIVYVTDMSGLKQIHEVRAEFFERPYPASTLVQVASLVEPELLIEISAVAVVPEGRARSPG